MSVGGRRADQIRQFSVNMVTIRLAGTSTHFAGWGGSDPVWLRIPNDRIIVYIDDSDVDFLADLSSLRRNDFDVEVAYWKGKKK